MIINIYIGFIEYHWMVQIFYINYNKGFLHTMILNNLKNKSLETKKQMKYNSIFNSYAYYVICTFFFSYSHWFGLHYLWISIYFKFLIKLLTTLKSLNFFVKYFWVSFLKITFNSCCNIWVYRIGFYIFPIHWLTIKKKQKNLKQII